MVGPRRCAGARLAASPGQHQIGSRALSRLSHWNTACFVWVRNVPFFFCACGFRMIQGCCFRHPVSHSPSPFSLWSWVHSQQLSTPAFCPHNDLIPFKGCLKSSPVASYLVLKDLLLLCHKLTGMVKRKKPKQFMPSCLT